MTPPTEMTWAMMKAAKKAPTMFPRPPSTQIMNVSGPKAPPKYGWTAYWMIRSAPAHQRDGLAVLAHRADRGAGVGAGEEEVERHHGQDREREGEQPGERDEDAADLDGGHVDPDRPVVRAPQQGGRGLDEEQEAAGGEELVDRRAREDRGDDQQVHERAQHRPDHDRSEAREPERPAPRDQEVDRVHAERDQIHVGDPDDVDDAEDEVEAEGEQGQHPAEQDAVDHRLQEEDRIEHAQSPT